MLIDGEVVNIHQEGAAATSEYAEYSASIGQFADGEAHVVSFEYDGGSASTSDRAVNIMEIDDVAIGEQRPPRPRSVLPPMVSTWLGERRCSRWS